MIIEHGQDIIFSTDYNGRILYISPQIDRYGYSPSDVQGRMFLDFIYEKDREKSRADFLRLLQTGDVFASQFRIVTQNETTCWLEARSVLLNNPEEPEMRIAGGLRDITEQKQAEKAFQKRLVMEKFVADFSLQCLDLTPEKIDAAIEDALKEIGTMVRADRSYVFLLDDNQKTLSNTHEWCAYGIEPQKDYLQHQSQEEVPWWMDRLRRFEPINITRVENLPSEAAAEKKVLEAQGIQSLLVVPIEWGGVLRGFLGFDAVKSPREWNKDDDNVIDTLANTLAFTLKHKQTESELFNQERLYHTLVDDMPGLICRFTSDGILTFVNDEYCRFFSKKSEDLVGHSFIPLIPEEDRSAVREAFLSCRSDQPVVTYVHRIILPGNKIRWLRWIDRALFDENNKICEYQSIGIDVTKQRRLEEQLFHAQKMESITMLTGGIVHDFNNNLQTIMGYSELALVKIDKENPLYTDLQGVLEAAKRSKRLTQQLLAFSRKQSLKTEVLELNTLIKELRKVLKQMLGEDVEIKTTLSRNLTRVRIDVSQIEQVILNLAANARDAMPRGGKFSIRTDIIELGPSDTVFNPEARPGSFVCLTVTDTGIGIPSDAIDKIFEPFFTTKKEGKGTGLGLPTVYGIVRQMEGWIHVYSEENQGATFKIYLPLINEPGGSKRKKPGPDRQQSVHRSRILVVEDEENIARVARRILSQCGHTAVIAAGVIEAQSVFDKAQEPFDLLFSDVVLRDGNGIDLAEELLARRPDLKVLFASGYVDERSHWTVMEQRGWICLQKPYALNDLFNATERILASEAE